MFILLQGRWLIHGEGFRLSADGIDFSPQHVKLIRD